MSVWPFHNTALARYWLKVFAGYALVEACIQLLFLYILNNYGVRTISNWEFHLIMWVFQCVLIWPIWWMAKAVSSKPIIIQVSTALAFYLLYTYIWFDPIQQWIAFLHEQLQNITRSPDERIKAYVDRSNQYTYISYQLLKHGFRLSWFFLADYFYHYRLEEKKRMELAISNKELQLKLLKWHLNPQFYFKTIEHLRIVATDKPVNCTAPILQLAKVMEYVIYEAKERLIDVQKEIYFLRTYIDLLGKQPGSKISFDLAVEGDYQKLRIAPLLLAGIIDKYTSNSQNHYRLLLEFCGQELQFTMHADNKPGQSIAFEKDTSYIRLQELYKDRYSFLYAPQGSPLQIKLKLDDGQ